MSLRNRPSLFCEVFRILNCHRLHHGGGGEDWHQNIDGTQSVTKPGISSGCSLATSILFVALDSRKAPENPKSGMPPTAKDSMNLVLG